MKFFAPLFLFLKGMAMGFADLIPGVSGGTIALVAGIYEELIHSIRSISVDALMVLKRKGIVHAFNYINGKFLLTLGAGIATSIIIFTRLVVYLLENHPVLLWSFFFGLVLASSYFLSRQVSRVTGAQMILFLIAVGFSFLITLATPVAGSDSLLYLFFCGFVGICAMILPGISGSFILLLLGMYQYVITALKDINLTVIAVFGLGCAMGLLSFSRVLAYLFKNYRDLTLTFLTGFMLGSLNKVWPWKIVVSTRLNSRGEKVPFLQESVLPGNYENLTQQDPYMLIAIVFMLAGMATILLLEKLSQIKSMEGDRLASSNGVG